MADKEATRRQLSTIRDLSESATAQAAETIKETTEEIADRLAQLRRRLGLEPRRNSHAELKAVGR